ncbi:hypothetical protein BKA18_000821 [Streptomyces auratus]
MRANPDRAPPTFDGYEAASPECERHGFAPPREPSIGICQTPAPSAVYRTNMPRYPLQSYEEESRAIAL